jgi:uncharacterized protein (DUF305 family)
MTLLSACNPRDKQAESQRTTSGHQRKDSVNLMRKAMDESMVAMHETKQTGNADYDFSVMMIPHHEGAVEMAESLIQKGKSAELINFAQQVIEVQTREIKTLKSFLKNASKSPSSNFKDLKIALNNSMKPMMESMHAIRLSGNMDKDFVALMIPHHQSAVEMARAYLPYGRNAEIKKLAKEIIDSQEKEIEWLKTR